MWSGRQQQSCSSLSLPLLSGFVQFNVITKEHLFTASMWTRVKMLLELIGWGHLNVTQLTDNELCLCGAEGREGREGGRRSKCVRGGGREGGREGERKREREREGGEKKERGQSKTWQLCSHPLFLLQLTLMPECEVLSSSLSTAALSLTSSCQSSPQRCWRQRAWGRAGHTVPPPLPALRSWWHHLGLSGSSLAWPSCTQSLSHVASESAWNGGVHELFGHSL